MIETSVRKELKVIGWVKVHEKKLHLIAQSSTLAFLSLISTSPHWYYEFQIFNEISANGSTDKYSDTNNFLPIIEEVNANKVDWRETLQQNCHAMKKSSVQFRRQIGANKSTFSSVTTVKELLPFPEKVYSWQSI